MNDFRVVVLLGLLDHVSAVWTLSYAPYIANIENCHSCLAMTTMVIVCCGIKILFHSCSVTVERKTRDIEMVEICLSTHSVQHISSPMHTYLRSVLFMKRVPAVGPAQINSSILSCPEHPLH